MHKTYHNYNTMLFHIDSAQSNLGKQFEVLVDVDYRIIRKFTETDEPETNIFFFHKDHLGSSTQISDMGQKIIHHIEYMPTGEQFLEQRDYWHTPFKFNGKELDEETGLYYYGARYYTPEVGVWLSVDPLSDKYPSISSFAYCLNNPVKLIDPDGMEVEYSSIEDRVKVAYLRLTSSEFRHSFKTLKKSEETYVFSGGKDKKNEFITDGEKLFINFSTTAHETEGTTWANNIKHESEHAMQFEHGEVGFELFVNSSGESKWETMNFDLNDEFAARTKGYEGNKMTSNPGSASSMWYDNLESPKGIERNFDVLQNMKYVGGREPKNNQNHEKIKSSTQYYMPHRKRSRPNIVY